MAGWHHNDCFKEKNCKVCGKAFFPKGGYHKFCSGPCKGKWKYLSGEMTTERQYQYISGNWRRYFNRLCCRSQGRASLVVEDLISLLEKQNGRCALTGIELTCTLEKGIKFKTNASLDRIEAGGPYIKENIQLVCSAVNCLRLDMNVQEFIWWCKKVSEFNV